MFNGLRQRYCDAMTSRVENDSRGFRIIKGNATDCITLLFESSSPLLAVDESMEGYKDLIDHLPDYIPGISPFKDWFVAVPFPAFAPTPTVIYCR